MLATRTIKILFISLFLSVVLLDVIEHLLGMDHIEICIEEESDNKEDTSKKDLEDKLFKPNDRPHTSLSTVAQHHYIYLDSDALYILAVPSPPPDALA